MKTIKSFLIAGMLFVFSAAGQQLNPQPAPTGNQALTQKQSSSVWKDIDESSFSVSGIRYITPTEYRTVQLNIGALNPILDATPLENSGIKSKALLELPLPDGSLETFQIVESPIMEKALQDNYPEISTYKGSSSGNSGAIARFDVTPQGFHAMIMIPGKSTIFIDPYSFGGDDFIHYIVYERSDFVSSAQKVFDCSFVGATTTAPQNSNGKASFSSCEMRTYRLALAATGEYTSFHGGTVALALAAQVTTMNRVNMVYNRDMSIQMNIVANNNLLIYTNSGSDPYTNNNGATMLGENQTNVDNIIGSANYDIGHVFSTGGGGIAGLGVVCWGGQKARGVTGSSAPIGDAFDIDYVCHEMGHQFGANHTQNNSCNRNNATAMEPGSASTIMGYAGICAPNVQSNSDDHFHGISMQEIGATITGHSCPVTTTSGNTAPTISGTNASGITIPANTPFALTATATDPEGDPMTYNWEQMDNDVTTQPPVSTATGGPNFRSFPSSTSPTRYFPNLADLSSGAATTWEVLPSVSRTFDFRCTVRDNSPSGQSCHDHTDITINVDNGSGPFVVTYPTATGISWVGLTSQTVTWDVANTDVAPVACANVDILLSTDGGLTYPTTLASNVPNDGSQAITVPNTPTTAARIMVICNNGTFFDISDNNFEITAATFDYTLSTTNSSVSICSPNDAVYTIDIGEVGGYSDPVTLSVSGVPAGATSNFSVNPVTPIGSSNLTISNTGAVTPGSYTMTVTANSTSGTKTLDLTLNVSTGSPTAVTLSSPTNGATGVGTPASLTWSASSEPGATYEIEIATDAGFTSIVEQSTGLSTNSYTTGALAGGTQHFWRVRVVTGCGTSAWSTVFSFTTSNCSTYTATDTPITISASGTPTITSTINVAATGTIQDVNVASLIGTHTWINDLTVTLASPTGTSVTLWNQICNNEDNFDVAFDDAATPGALPCPPTGGGTYQPATVLSAFNGESPTGNWVLTITDNVNQDGGALTSWSLELCLASLPEGTDVITACDSYTWIDGVTYTASNNTATHIIVGGAANGGDSLANLDLTINYSTSGSESATACDSYTWSANSTTYTASGTYTATLTNAAGCDSTATLNLIINNSTSGSESATACDSYTWAANSTTYTASGTYTATLTNAAGCDSTATLNLTINNSTSGSESVTACNNYTWSANSTTYTASGTYTATLTNAAGCDSTATLNLTITTFAAGTDVITACDSYMWIDGVTYTASNNTATHTIVGGSVNGCDSIVTLNLTINNSTAGSESVTACDSYTWTANSTTYTASGTYTATLTNAAGCDSTATLNLTINNSTSSSESVTACDSYTWTTNSTTYTASGTYTATLTNAAGCDSTATLNLTINNSTSGSESVTACDSYTWATNSTTYSASGTYTATLTNVAGCDSTATLNLIINNSTSGSESVTACDSYTWTANSTTYAASGTYTATLTNAAGCDSTATLNLTINNSTSGSESVTACDLYTWAANSTTYTASGTYTATLTNAAGCDSTATLNLTINNSTSGSESATACDSYTWTANSTTYTASGTYTATLTNAEGCDSTATLNLTINTVDVGVTLTSYNTIQANFAGGSYQWINCNDQSVITGETGETLVATANGNYAVIVTDGNCSDTSECIAITTIGIDEINNVVFEMYPNPADNILIVEITNVSSYDYKMYDATGRVVLEGNLNSGVNQISVIDLARGTYRFELVGTPQVKSIIKL